MHQLITQTTSLTVSLYQPGRLVGTLALFSFDLTWTIIKLSKVYQMLDLLQYVHVDPLSLDLCVCVCVCFGEVDTDTYIFLQQIIFG